MDTSDKILNVTPSFRDRSTVVFTNGCFDLLHSGHIYLLEKAKSLGSILVVGVNSDESVRGLKGDGRPINSLKDRCRVLAALQCVDCVVPFDDDTPEKLVEVIRPGVLVKGSDWSGKEVAGSQWADKVVFIPTTDTSTTKTINKIEERQRIMFRASTGLIVIAHDIVEAIRLAEISELSPVDPDERVSFFVDGDGAPVLVQKTVRKWLRSLPIGVVGSII